MVGTSARPTRDPRRVRDDVSAVSSFLRIAVLTFSIIAASIAAVVLLTAAANHNSGPNRIERVKKREPQDIRIRQIRRVELPSTAWNADQPPATAWTVRRHSTYARDLASIEVSPGSGPAGIAPFDLSRAGDWLVWNSTLRTYLIHVQTGQQIELAGCGNVDASGLSDGDLIVSGCGTLRRMSLDGVDLHEQWTADFDFVDESAGEYAVAYTDDSEEAAVINLRTGDVLYRFDAGDAEAIAVDERGQLAIAEGVYPKGSEEWDIPSKIRVRVLNASGDKAWSHALDIEPNGLGLTLSGDDLSVSNWDYDGREHVVTITERGSLEERPHVASSGDILAERGGFKVLRGAMDGKLRLIARDRTSRPLGSEFAEEWTTATITRDMVLIADETSLRAFRTTDAQQLWTVPLAGVESDATPGRAIVATPTTIFVAGPSTLVALGGATT